MGQVVPQAQDVVRRAKLQAVETITHVPLVVYATDFLNGAKVAHVGADGVSINLTDKMAFIEATNGISSGPLDVLLHSPGGSPTATESVVALLRSRFNPIRFIVPNVAKSAATMLALSGNEILMSPSGELGPIDPQMLINREGRTIIAPAQAILDQFDSAGAEILANPQKLAVWLPMLRDLGPSLRQECLNAIDLSKVLVRTWLQSYMLQGDPEAEQKADAVVNYLGNHNNFKSHARRVDIKELSNLGAGLKIADLGAPTAPTGLLTAVTDAYLAIDITFQMTGAYKIVEHYSGNAFIQSEVLIGLPVVQAPQVVPPRLPMPQQSQGLNRQQRRHPPR